MSEMPNNFKLINKTINIIEKTEKQDEMLKTTKGYYDDRTLTIVIDKDQHEYTKKIALFHEIMHACLNTIYIPVFPKMLKDSLTEDDYEHRTIHALEEPLLYVLKNNKNLLDYLIMEDS